MKIASKGPIQQYYGDKVTIEEIENKAKNGDVNAISYLKVEAFYASMNDLIHHVEERKRNLLTELKRLSQQECNQH